MKQETRIVTHVDGKTKVMAKGKVINGEFVGEYKFQGMTYGVTLPSTTEARLDELSKGDFVLDSKGIQREVARIKNGMAGTNWHSINMVGTDEYIIGHPHQVVQKLNA